MPLGNFTPKRFYASTPQTFSPTTVYTVPAAKGAILKGVVAYNAATTSLYVYVNNNLVYSWTFNTTTNAQLKVVDLNIGLNTGDTVQIHTNSSSYGIVLSGVEFDV